MNLTARCDRLFGKKLRNATSHPAKFLMIGLPDHLDASAMALLESKTQTHRIRLDFLKLQFTWA